MNVAATSISVTLLAAHLVATNIATAGPLLCVWLRYRAGRSDTAADSIGRRLAHLSLSSLLVGIALGLLLGALFWAGGNARYWDAVHRFPLQTYGYAVIELAFTAACYWLYATMWERWRSRPWQHAAIAVLGTTNLVYHLPPLMIALGELAARPEWVVEPLITRPVFRRLLVQPDVFSMLVHYVVASVAVGGVVLMLVASRSRAVVRDGRSIGQYTSAGACIALAATMMQLAVGAWLLMQLPGPSRNAMMGDDLFASALFLGALVAMAAGLQLLLRIALGEGHDRLVQRSTIALMCVVVLMTAAQTRSRQLAAAASRFNQVSTGELDSWIHK